MQLSLQRSCITATFKDDEMDVAVNYGLFDCRDLACARYRS